MTVMKPPHRTFHPALGFSFIELVMVLAVVAIVAAIALPTIGRVADSIRVSTSGRAVERELQSARLTAVSANRAMRVRFNCPGPGQFRMVELIGTPRAPDAADSAADRCDPVKYPYPVPDRNVLTRPNNDGPVRTIDSLVQFTTTTTVEFWPDGTAHSQGASNPWPAIVAPVTISVQRGTYTKSITVNGVGKVQVQ
jgi:prepilin-type N-terminal cleavage/methylation domain-containing protein